MKANRVSLISTLLLLALSSVASIAASQSQTHQGKYHSIKRITIGGEGGWDYLTLDSTTRRLYVSHSTRVEVVDVESGKKVGEIPNTNGVHGIAIVP